MNFVLQPWQLLLVALAGWVNRKQQAVIDFQGTQIQVLMEKLGKKRLLLSDDQRCRLAVKAKVLGRKALTRDHHDLHSRYDIALASAIGGEEMGLQPPSTGRGPSSGQRGDR